jgi:hypothetical protein
MAAGVAAGEEGTDVQRFEREVGGELRNARDIARGHIIPACVCAKKTSRIRRNDLFRNAGAGCTTLTIPLA